MILFGNLKTYQDRDLFTFKLENPVVLVQISGSNYHRGFEDGESS
jgi:hypothetical protein